MSESYLQLSALLGRVRNRWRAIVALRACTYAATGAGSVLALALLTHWFARPEGGALVLLWTVAGAVALAALVWVIASLRKGPRDLQIARFVEERCPELEDSLVTAIAQPTSDDSPMTRAVVHDAARRARHLELDGIISRLTLRRTAVLAAAAALAFIISAGFSAGPVEQAARVMGVYLFPYRLGLQVTPGDVKVRAGESLQVRATMSGGAAVVPVLRVGGGKEWRETRMEAGPDGFAVTIHSVEKDFRYAVTAAGTSSREYGVTVLHAPRVERIDLRYDYPAGFGMPPREEEDGGDIYGPAGTRVRVTVHTDKPVRQAALNLAGGAPIALTGRSDAMTGELIITEDGSYRVSLADADGLTNPGETEYFIRTLQDRPPDVRIIRPASDRQVTPVEEVPIEASADDDFGVATLELVYAIRGGVEKVVPFDRIAGRVLSDPPGANTAVTGRRTLYLEDLGVRPGDFVAYHARARDVSRGKRSSEARSDIFFLEVTPFEEEFVAAESQGMGGGSGDEKSLEELIQAQKDIITATWNLDRRAREAGGRSQDDIRTVGRAQRDLRARAAAMLAEMQRAGLRRRLPAGRGGQVNADAMAEAIGRAVQAMGSAHAQLESLKTTEALPHEMTALNELLRAQAEVRRRQVQQQQANGSGGRGSNRQQQDLSSLFDRELAKQQQTNYETPASRETRQEQETSDEVLDRIAELARRQDALTRREQELARRGDTAPQEELRRELERLTREQSELRRQAEELARELQQNAQGQQSARGRQGGRGGSGSEQQQASRDLQQASEEMQGAASELRRENPQQASARAGRAAERLRDLEQRLRGAQPDDRRRALGELRLESRQLADAQRRLGREGGASGDAGDRADRARRRASEQDRLAERAERLDEAVRELAGGRGADPKEQTALSEAVQELDRSRPSERMRDAARAERESAGRQSGQGANQRGGQSDATRRPGPLGPSEQPSTQRQNEEIARGLDRVADRLGAAGGESQPSQQLSEELSRLRQLREELATLDRQLAELRDGAGNREGGQNGRGQNGRQNGRGAQGSGAGQNVDAAGPWQEARELLNELRDNAVAPDVDGFNPGRSAPGTEAWKQDFARWDELKIQLAAALERAERTAADRLREQQSRDRLNAGTTQAVPEQYRKLVERYYRALAGGK
jgi:hypothetical protein